MKVCVVTSHRGHGEGFTVEGVFSTTAIAKQRLKEADPETLWVWTDDDHAHYEWVTQLLKAAPFTRGIYLEFEEYEVEA